MAFAAASVVSPSHAVVLLDVTGTIDATDPTQTGRLVRNGVASTWAAPKTNPGLFTAVGLRHYDLYTIDPGIFNFVEVTLFSALGTTLFDVGYLNTFVPSSPDTNYLGDPGASDLVSTYQVIVPPGQDLAAVVHEVNPDGALGAEYRLLVLGFLDANRTDVVGVPTPATLPLVALSLAVLLWVRGRRKLS